MGKSHPEAHDKNRITTESIPNERGGLVGGRPFLCFDIRVRGGIPRQNGFDGQSRVVRGRFSRQSGFGGFSDCF